MMTEKDTTEGGQKDIALEGTTIKIKVKKKIITKSSRIARG